MSKAKSVLVLIDGSNIFHAISAIGDRNNPYRINYEKLLELIEREVGTISKKFYFSAEPPGNSLSPVRKKYIKLLRKLGLDVRSIPLRQKTFTCKSCKASFSTFLEKGVDVAIAVEALKHALPLACDSVVIVSGSGVYIPVVDTLQAAGVQTVVAAFKDHCSVSVDLTTRADRFLNLSEHVEDMRLTFEQRESEEDTDKPSPYMSE